MKAKEKLISKIKAIIEEFGSFSTADVELDNSPVIANIGKDNFQLAERFNSSGVVAVTYVHETEVAEEEIDYEDLNKDVLDEILMIAENYKVDFEKTLDRCKD